MVAFAPNASPAVVAFAPNASPAVVAFAPNASPAETFAPKASILKKVCVQAVEHFKD